VLAAVFSLDAEKPVGVPEIGSREINNVFLILIVCRKS